MKNLTQRGNQNIGGVVNSRIQIDNRRKSLIGAWGCSVIAVIGLVVVAGLFIKEAGSLGSKSVDVVATQLPVVLTVSAPTPTASTQLQPVVNDLDLAVPTADLIREFVAEFAAAYNQREAQSLAELNDVYIAQVAAGEVLEAERRAIAALKDEGLIYRAEFDPNQSLLLGVRRISEIEIEYDSCEYWRGEFFLAADGQLVKTVPLHLIPQTNTIQKIGHNWYVIRHQAFDPPAFCPSN